MSQKIISVILIVVIVLGGGYLVYRYGLQGSNEIIPNGENNEVIPPEDNQEPVSCSDQSGDTMLLEEAMAIAELSPCMEDGSLKETNVCNEATGTWWIDLEPYEIKEGCSPACVIDLATQSASVNWRCTGLIEE